MPVFISYSHDDKDFVDQLAAQLIKHNTHIWVERWEIKAGESLAAKLHANIKGAPAFIFVLSNSSIKSEWCSKELSAALMREIEEKSPIIIPVLLEKCAIPKTLIDKKYADFSNDFDEGLKEVLEGISKITSINQGRIESKDFHVDWGLDWRYVNQQFTMLFTLVEHSNNLPFTIVYSINIECNAPATLRYRQYEAFDLGWVGRFNIAAAISSYANKEDLRLLLKDQHQQSTSFSVKDSATESKYNVIIKARWLGINTGNDVLVNISQHLKGMMEFMSSISRTLSPEENAKLMTLFSN